MKIFIAASWLKLGGGVTRTLLELFKHIDYSKYDVTLMLMELDKDVLRYVPEDVRVISSNDSFQTASSGQIIKNALKNGKLFTAISYAAEQIDWKMHGDNYRHQQWITNHMEKQEEEYDVAISYAMMNSIVNKYVIDNVKARKKILWCHTDINLYKEKYIKGLEKLFVQFDRINCVSSSAMKSLKEKHPELSKKLHVVYNYIDTDRIMREAQAPVDINIDNEKIKLCTVSRISKEKGTDLVVECAKKLNENGHNFEWWVVGPEFDKNFTDTIKQKISEYSLEDKVLLLGEKNPPYPYMRACDIYVQPSRCEGFCLTTSEAKAFARPCVVTDFSGAREQFTDGIDANIADISVNSVFEAIKDLCESEEKRKMYSDNLRNNPKALNFISFEEMIL